MKNEIVAAITAKIAEKRAPGKRFILAVDGRCAAGKTTLAEELKNRLDCVAFHTDDYFLRPEQRTKERLSTPGGNFDRERFIGEILLPLSRGERTINYQKFDCKAGKLVTPPAVFAGDVVIIEGSYACHPDLCGFYDLKIFLSVEREEQLARIAARNGDAGLKNFVEKWIPLEEAYFAHFGIAENCDLVF